MVAMVQLNDAMVARGSFEKFHGVWGSVLEKNGCCFFNNVMVARCYF